MIEELEQIKDVLPLVDNEILAIVSLLVKKSLDAQVSLEVKNQQQENIFLNSLHD